MSIGSIDAEAPTELVDLFESDVGCSDLLLIILGHVNGCATRRHIMDKRGNLPKRRFHAGGSYDTVMPRRKVASSELTIPTEDMSQR
jgi:hypothetical protein